MIKIHRADSLASLINICYYHHVKKRILSRTLPLVNQQIVKSI